MTQSCDFFINNDIPESQTLIIGATDIPSVSKTVFDPPVTTRVHNSEEDRIEMPYSLKLDLNNDGIDDLNINGLADFYDGEYGWETTIYATPMSGSLELATSTYRDTVWHCHHDDDPEDEYEWNSRYTSNTNRFCHYDLTMEEVLVADYLAQFSLNDSIGANLEWQSSQGAIAYHKFDWWDIGESSRDDLILCGVYLWDQPVYIAYRIKNDSNYLYGYIKLKGYTSDVELELQVLEIAYMESP